MGAWGVLAFDNDEACDWASGLNDADDLSLLESTFAEVEANPDGYLDSHEGCNALAACEVLARLRGNPGYMNPYTKDVDAWVDKHEITPSPELMARARAVIGIVLGENSELRELWGDGDDTKWREGVEDLRRRLDMPANEWRSQKPPPEYVRSVGRHTQPIMGAIVGAAALAAGILGATIFVMGIRKIAAASVWHVQDDLSADLLVAILFMLLGMFCGFASMRWLKSAVGMLRRR